MESSKIKELAQDQQDYVVAMRREFHRSPELSGKEFHTRVSPYRTVIFSILGTYTFFSDFEV